MFAVEVIAGPAAGSASLQADALDFLGDTANYAIGLIVIGIALRYRALPATAKGATMAIFRLWVIATLIWHVVQGTLLNDSRADADQIARHRTQCSTQRHRQNKNPVHLSRPLIIHSAMLVSRPSIINGTINFVSASSRYAATVTAQIESVAQSAMTRE